MILSFGQIGLCKQCRPRSDCCSQIRLLLNEQSDQGLHCLPFCLHLLDSLLCRNATLFNSRVITAICSGVPIFRSFMVLFSSNRWAATWQNKQCGCAPSEDSDQPGHPPVWSVFAPRMEKAWVLSYPLSAQRRLWSDWADVSDCRFGVSPVNYPDAQADLSLRWVHTHFVGFVMLRFR